MIMAYGIYDGLVDGLLKLVSDILQLLLGFEIEFQTSLSDTLIDSLEMSTILGFLIVTTIMLIWFERKLVGRMMARRGPVFIDFNYGHFLDEHGNSDYYRI